MKKILGTGWSSNGSKRVDIVLGDDGHVWTVYKGSGRRVKFNDEDYSESREFFSVMADYFYRGYKIHWCTVDREDNITC